MTTQHEEKTMKRHPTYWFQDGFLILDVDTQCFKVHHDVVCRHSPFLTALVKDSVFQPQANLVEEHVTSAVTAHPSPGRVHVKHIVIDPSRGVKGVDVEALLQHLYHDVPLDGDSSFSHVAAVLWVSSPQQLDYPRIHALARSIFGNIFPTDPRAFAHITHPLHEALLSATKFNITSARKAILYSLVTRTDFDVSEEETSREDPQVDTQPSTTSESSGALADMHNLSHRDDGGFEQIPLQPPTDCILPPAVLSREDSKVCMNLMMRFINHFSPILFTPAATPHMNCTDVFAETWMATVIQPAIDDDGVYKPLETLQRMKETDWAKHGLCRSCVIEKRAEWEDEQRVVWGLMDTWLETEVDDTV